MIFVFFFSGSGLLLVLLFPKYGEKKTMMSRHAVVV